MPHVFTTYRPHTYPDGFLRDIEVAIRESASKELEPVNGLKPEHFMFKYLRGDDPNDKLNRDFTFIIIHPSAAGREDESGCAQRIAKAIEQAIRDFDKYHQIDSEVDLPDEISFSVTLLVGKVGFEGITLLGKIGMRRLVHAEEQQ
jgi:hypothetical protein